MSEQPELTEPVRPDAPIVEPEQGQERPDEEPATTEEPQPDPAEQPATEEPQL